MSFYGNNSLLIGSKKEFWTPSELGSSLILWLDADDVSTIVLNGSSVSRWNDKSGGARNSTQNTQTNQPIYNSTGFNNKPTIQFDGVDDVLIANAAGAAINTQNFTLLSAMRHPTSGGFIFNLREPLGSPNSLTTRGYVRRVGINNFNSLWGPAVSPPDMNVIDGTNNIVGIQRRSSNTVENFVNGVAGGSTTSSFASGFGVFSIGAFQTTAPSNWSNSWFSEIVIATGSMTTHARNQLEGYLSHKWGLTANLPNDHPYKLTAPKL